MTEKERTKKGTLRMLCSLGSYGFALLQPSIGAKLHISDDYIAFAIMVWILAGAVSACLYGSLPEPDVSDEVLDELQEMINARKDNWKLGA